MNCCRIMISLFLFVFMYSSIAIAAEPANVNNLDQLLEMVKQSAIENSRQNKQRETTFLQQKQQQQSLLNDAKKELRKEQTRSDRLKRQYQSNEKTLTDLETRLQQRVGSLGELFGVFRQVSGDTASILEESMITAQFSDRVAPLKSLAEQKALPSIPELEKLWFALQQEMTESGKVTSYSSNVLQTDGTEQTAQVLRLGPFTSVSEGQFLRFLPESGQLIELARQPDSAYQSIAQDFESTQTGYAPMIIDPSRGVLLGLLVQTPSLFERIQQGKLVGYIIIILGIIGLLLVIERIIKLSIEEKKINKQTSQDSPDKTNPLGRIMAVYFDNKNINLETLERKIDEAILKETPKLERGLPIIKILSVIAPLLGLLGTVTGMIDTFQSITLFGTGDPKLMAGGISQALVTTVLGLAVAIPLIMLHSIVNSKSKRCINILEEQSAGLIAIHAETGKP